MTLQEAQRDALPFEIRWLTSLPFSVHSRFTMVVQEKPLLQRLPRMKVTIASTLFITNVLLVGRGHGANIAKVAFDATGADAVVVGNNDDCYSSLSLMVPFVAQNATTVNRRSDASEEEETVVDILWYRRLSSENCAMDRHKNCAKWAARNECALLAERVLALCPAACQVCNTERHHTNNATVRNCYGKDQILPTVASDGASSSSSSSSDQVVERRLEQVHDYMFQRVFVHQKYNKVRGDCKNRHSACTLWAAAGECEANPSFMRTECAPACFTCEQLDFTARCPFVFDPNEPGIWLPGDLNRMFERIVQDPDINNVTIHSSPRMRTVVGPAAGAGSPWVVTIDDFLSESECNRLIELGHDISFERSGSVGAKRIDGTYKALFKNPGRTSTTAWCKGDCYNDPVSKAVQARIELLTGIPDKNSEHLQLLRYQEDEFYHAHHDYIPFHRERAQGVRILTVFLYLNDVDAGGGTRFPALNVTIQPKRGRVVLWPSVLDENPNRRDDLTVHEALPVKVGVKYSANGWLHQRNFKDPYHADCH